jgi:hypothetical protein
MSNFISILGIIFGAFVSANMIYLFKYNVETSGALFAVFIAVIPISATAGLIIHYLNNR